MSETINPHVGTRMTGSDLHRLPLIAGWVQTPHIRTGLSTDDRLIFSWDRKVIGYIKRSYMGMRYRVFPCKDWRSLVDSVSNGEIRPIGWAYTMGQAHEMLTRHWEEVVKQP
jgi:hypothetical protein